MLQFKNAQPKTMHMLILIFISLSECLKDNKMSTNSFIILEQEDYELLAAEVEENIRNFINTIFLHQVFDLKSDMANDMMQQLNSKFNKYGITFE